MKSPYVITLVLIPETVIAIRKLFKELDKREYSNGFWDDAPGTVDWLDTTLIPYIFCNAGCLIYLGETHAGYDPLNTNKIGEVITDFTESQIPYILDLLNLESEFEAMISSIRKEISEN